MKNILNGLKRRLNSEDFYIYGDKYKFTMPPNFSTFELSEKNLSNFISFLIKKYEVVAPVKKNEIHVFDKIEKFSEIDLNFINTVFPPKKYFFPMPENFFDYADGKIKKVSYEKIHRIIFGIRPCDVNAILNYNKVFLDEKFLDPYYKNKKENTLIFSLSCQKSGENCFCTSLRMDKLSDGFDLLFTKVDENYFIEVGSDKGFKLINKNKRIFKKTEKKSTSRLNCNKKITEDEIKKLETEFHSKVFEKYSEKCLSCCSCTMTCPTCTCFGLRDLINLDLISGCRCREWHSCQLKIFSRVAGEFVFREERYKRLKHRIYHQLNYFKKRYGRHLCVGCGRCISNCPTRIDMIEIIKKL